MSIKKRQYIRKLIGCMIIVIASWLISMISTLLIAAFLNGLGRTMSWYASSIMDIFLVCDTYSIGFNGLNINTCQIL
ncbi:hypothetical protein NQ314_011241 [Rhamnusium bicolor]|uniref:Uncharacterized protein n=1 Tax=Rhamnusium bicolor TaxID=1586634 RepID=A0AAV8XKU7_9CUCU|nr:hypothetical protein NQ314_011241 [Rhamnusium bicolor]